MRGNSKKIIEEKCGYLYYIHKSNNTDEICQIHFLIKLYTFPNIIALQRVSFPEPIIKNMLIKKEKKSKAIITVIIKNEVIRQ